LSNAQVTTLTVANGTPAARFGAEFRALLESAAVISSSNSAGNLLPPPPGKRHRAQNWLI
jgi:hypothetical protein